MRHAAPAAVFWLAVLLAPAPLKEQHAGLKFVSLVPGTINLDRVELPQTVPSFDLPANRLVFRQQEVRLVVEAGSDFLDDEVEVNGLLNPDIQVVRGARLTITVLNFSNMDASRFDLDAHAPPYNGEEVPNHSSWARLRGYGLRRSPVLPGRQVPNGPTLAAHEVYDVVETYIAEGPGTAYYSCGVPIWGCYGRIIVMP